LPLEDLFSFDDQTTRDHHPSLSGQVYESHYGLVEIDACHCTGHDKKGLQRRVVLELKA